MNAENELPADEPSEAASETVEETGEEMGETEADVEAQAERDAAMDAEADALRAAEVEAFEAEEQAAPDAEALKTEVAELKDKLLRAVAESENTRRIAAREKADAGKYAVTNFARDIVRVADNLSMAMTAVTGEARQEDKNLDNLCVGIDMTMQELLNIFAGYGIKPVPAEGQPFDHNIHEAVQQVENTEVPSGTVLQVLRGGFTIQDRLLRPAQVIVSTGGPKANGGDADAATPAEPPAEASGDGGPQAYEAEGTEPGQNVDEET